MPAFKDILAARERVRNRVLKTPVLNSPRLDEWLGCRASLKCEQDQPTGAFKLRGASNAVARLEEAGVQGDLATHSSGNHGAALAWAARAAGRRAFVVMPENAVRSKVDAVRHFGGEVIFCAPGQAPREEGLAKQVALGRLPVPPYDHEDIIAGQGTAALELLEQVSGLKALVAPLGGGGLLAGCALAAKGIDEHIAVYGAEPAGAADTAASLAQGARVESWSPDTVADGLRALVGKLNFDVIRNQVTEVLLSDDEAIVAAMRAAFERADLRIEPSAAVALAVIRKHRDHFEGQSVGVLLTGGNIDLDRFPWLAPATPQAPGKAVEAHD
ncbi:MAG: pyridoxal-phosphate dependent enzyme [Pseudomonadota bacterium]